jgi:hypothetical protein
MAMRPMSAAPNNHVDIGRLTAPSTAAPTGPTANPKTLFRFIGELHAFQIWQQQEQEQDSNIEDVGQKVNSRISDKITP